MKENLNFKIDMKDIIDKVINNLKSIDIYNLERIRSEEDFEKFIVNKLDLILDKKIKLNTQNKSYKEGRQIRPDISIGLDDILIELKYNIKNVNDIYRLFYQAIKYSKLAKELLILCIHDPKSKLLLNDIKDLESISKVKVIHIF